MTPTVGESLPDLDVGYNSDNCEVSIPNNDKYDIVSAKWSSTKNDVKIGGTYTMKVTLKTLNDYRFSSSSYTSSTASHFASPRSELPDFVVCQYASPGASRSPFAGFVFTVTTRRSEDVLEALTKVPFFTFTFEEV